MVYVIKALAVGLLLVCGTHATPTAFQSTCAGRRSPSKQCPNPRHGAKMETNFVARPTFSSSSLSTSKPSTTRLQAAPPAAAAALSGVVAANTQVLGSLLVLATVVIIHEAGHYLAARGFGMTVEEFSVGFGPKLFGFTAFGDEFNLRALPLGGYVRFPENYNATVYEEQRKKRRDALSESAKNRRQDMELGSKILDILTFGALSDKQSIQEAEEAVAAEAAKPWWKRRGGRNKAAERQAALAPVEIDYYDDPNLLQNRPWPQRAVVLSAGVIFNLLLSFGIYFGEIGFGSGLPQPIFAPGVMVSSIPRMDAAAQGVLRKGDVVLDVNGSPLTLSESPTMIESQKAISNFIATIRATNEGEDLQLSVLRAKDKEAGTVETVRIAPKRLNPGSPLTIGTLLSPNLVRSEMLQSNNPLEAARMAANYGGTLTKDTATGLATFFGEMLTGQMGGSSSSAPASSQVSGPIGLIKAGSEIVSTRDLTTVLLFAAAISINLGVANALPLPALDGGQLVFVFIEAVIGRKVDQRVQENITGAAVVFLLWLSLNAAIGDISSIIGR